jgi:hypothetical protein
LIEPFQCYLNRALIVIDYVGINLNGHIASAEHHLRVRLDALSANIRSQFTVRREKLE